MNPKKTFAVSIGIGSYLQLPKLNCPPNDAKDFAAIFDSSITRTEVNLLTDSNATKSSILKGLAWLANNAGPSDSALVFFGGHGGRQSTDAVNQAYLCPVDASLLDLEQTCISSAELSDGLRAIKSERLIVMLDTCYSGGIGEARCPGMGLTAGLNSRDVNALIEGAGRVILAATRPDEPAWELAGMRNGLFTNYLLLALRGEVAQADGSIWASDVFSYVSRSVRQHKCQRPYQKAVGEDFVVMVQRDKPLRPLQMPALAPVQIDQRSLRLAMRRAYDREELSLLCRDLGLSLEDLPGRTLGTQLMDLIDYCYRHGLYDQLLDLMKAERPNLALRSGTQTTKHRGCMPLG